RNGLFRVKVAVGPSTGNVYVTGSTTASSQAFVMQLNAAGAVQWTATTSGGFATGAGVAVYDTPNGGPQTPYVTGEHEGTVTVGATVMTSSTEIFFVWKLNADGTTAQAKDVGSLVGNGSYNSGDGITVDGAGNPYVTGRSSSPNFVARLD